MIPLNDERWKEFEGGHRRKYDASTPLSKLEAEASPDEVVWEDLCENLYQQGDVGLASYAAIPHIARIIRQRKILDVRPFALAVAIELVRGEDENPPLPEWLAETYYQSLQDMAEYACANLRETWDAGLVKPVLSLLAITKGNRDLGELIFEVDDGDEQHLLDKYFGD